MEVLVQLTRSCCAQAWQIGFWADCLPSALITAPGKMISITRATLIILPFTCMLPSWQHWGEVKKFCVICLCNFNFFPTFSIWFCKSQILWVFILTDLFPSNLLQQGLWIPCCNMENKPACSDLSKLHSYCFSLRLLLPLCMQNAYLLKTSLQVIFFS